MPQLRTLPSVPIAIECLPRVSMPTLGLESAEASFREETDELRFDVPFVRLDEDEED
jgi:hypothetical protein